MIWTILAQLYLTLLELLRLSRLPADEKDLEILILRQQLDVMVRKSNQVVRPSKDEKWSLAMLAAALPPYMFHYNFPLAGDRNPHPLQAVRLLSQIVVLVGSF